MIYDIAIIGGGASGLIASIKAKMTDKNLNVLILEKNQRVGKKILSTGNGRCNLTNSEINTSRFHGENLEIIERIFSEFGLEETLDFFLSIGVLPYLSSDGKYYPNSLQASSVLDMLRFKAVELGIEVKTEFQVSKLKYNNNFYISSIDNKSVVSKRLIVATGGKAAPNMGSDGDGYEFMKKFGHSVTELYPSLVQIKCPSKQVVPMKGVKVNANISLYADNELIKKEYGEVLFTDYGLSGPPVFQISGSAAFATQKNKKTYVELDIIPTLDLEKLTEHILSRNKRLLIDEFLTGLFNKQLGKMLVKQVGIEKFGVSAEVLTDSQLKNIAKLCKCWRFDVTGTNSWMQAQTTSGGVRTKEFDYSTLESKYCKGLYACGELLDIDGDCGGFNLQWAWSSGAVAGVSAAMSLMR